MNQVGDPEQAPDGLEVIREYDDSSTTNHDASSINAAPSLIKSKKDESLVMCSRAVVVAVLLLSALIVALLVYHIVSHDEEHDFKVKVSQSLCNTESQRQFGVVDAADSAERCHCYHDGNTVRPNG